MKKPKINRFIVDILLNSALLLLCTGAFYGGIIAYILITVLMTGLVFYNTIKSSTISRLIILDTVMTLSAAAASLISSALCLNLTNDDPWSVLAGNHTAIIISVIAAGLSIIGIVLRLTFKCIRSHSKKELHPQRKADP